ncbi:MAG TPA: HAMP domain-containing sensor histidine kinase [Rhizomicrobium sp.]|nr:HAMP domain-containing sensor histidine kinase [Rhizomicrobium sp.]
MRFRLNSLQSRIAFFHLLAILIAAMLVPLANYLVIYQSANQFEVRSLRDHAATIAQYLSRTPDGWRLDLPEDLQTLYAHGLDGLSYTVADAQNRALFSSNLQGGAARVPISSQRLQRYSENGAEFYSLALKRGEGDDAIWIKVAQNIQHPDVIFDDIVSSYLGHIGWFTVTILALLLAIDIIVIRNALKPVLRASEIASAVDPARTNLRLPDHDMPQELLPLIASMNQALDRLEQGIRVQREFTADAAHELRTPLAVLRTRVETMPDREGLDALKLDILVMTHVVDQLMEMAEVEGNSAPPTATIDLRAVSAEVAAMMAEIAIRQDRSIALTGTNDPVWVRGDGAMIFRAVRNLAENAIKHTAPGTVVELEVGDDGSVAVMDRGPGVPEKDRALIFRRFWRSDRNPTQGAGLGLAIVAKIAEIHAGIVTVSSRPGGGAVFTMQFARCG